MGPNSPWFDTTGCYKKHRTMEKVKNGILEDVILIRFSVIILLLLCHSFTIYGYGWKSPDGIDTFLPYKLISQIAYAAMLETFVFISGYVFQSQVINGKLKGSAVGWISKKAKRLLVPSIIFSALWIILFKPFESSTIIDFIKNLSCAHLWFLPMLFWCFACGFVIQKKDICNKKTLFAMLILVFAPRFSFIPLRINPFMEYGFFFVLGMYIFKNREKIGNRLQQGSILAVTSIMFLSTFYLSTIINNHFAGTLINFVCSLSGLFLIYGLCNRIIDNIKTLPNIITITAKYSFAIYVIHQFILFFLYYYTSLPALTGQYILPWCALIITTFVSYVLSHYILKTKTGKLLLG